MKLFVKWSQSARKTLAVFSFDVVVWTFSLISFVVAG
jgi:hypothetical protein